MATIHFTLDEALKILWKNIKLPGGIKDIKPARDGLMVFLPLGINVNVRQESFSLGILKLKIESGGWLSGIVSGKIEKELDKAIENMDFVERQDNFLLINLNSALQTKVKGIRVENFELCNNEVRIKFS